MYHKVKEFVGATYKATSIRYHRNHRRLAEAALKNIEKDRGPLGQENRAKCDEYAKDVFGDQRYAPWLHVYAAMAGEFREGWIPDNFYGRVLKPQLKGAYGSVSDLKPLNRAMFRSPHFPDIASHINGLFVDREYRILEDGELLELLFKAGDRIVFKVDHSSKGYGIHVFSKENFNLERVKALGNGVFQHYIDQAEEVAEFSNSAVATLRITTTTELDGSAKVRASHFRVGRQGDTHVESSSSLRLGVDIADGSLTEVGYYKDWTTTPVHPDSGKQFAGFRYPMFEEACKIALELHEKVPYVHCVGWDLCVDRDGKVHVMEWNGAHNGIRINEALQGPCFRGLNWERFAKRGKKARRS